MILLKKISTEFSTKVNNAFYAVLLEKEEVMISIVPFKLSLRFFYVQVPFKSNTLSDVITYERGFIGALKPSDSCL